MSPFALLLASLAAAAPDPALLDRIAKAQASNDWRVACPGIATLLVERDDFVTFFISDHEGAFDAIKLLEQGECAKHPEMLRGLEARVDHGQLWSVVGYAEVAWRVPGHEVEACTAWAEALTLSRHLPDLHRRGLLGHVAECGDLAALEMEFGPDLPTNATGQCFRGEALGAQGKPAEACEAYQRAYQLDPTAYSHNINRSAFRGIRASCDADLATRFVTETAAAGAGEAGRAPEQRVRYAGDLSKLPMGNIEAECVALADALTVAPYFDEPPEVFFVESCSETWRAETGRRLEALAADATEAGRADDAARLSRLAGWVLHPPGR